MGSCLGEKNQVFSRFLLLKLKILTFFLNAYFQLYNCFQRTNRNGKTQQYSLKFNCDKFSSSRIPESSMANKINIPEYLNHPNDSFFVHFAIFAKTQNNKDKIDSLQRNCETV